MFKILVLGLLATLLVACTPHDEQYYRENPKELQKVIKECPDNRSTALTPTCNQLRTVATQVNLMAYELQVNPQQFGKKIISLQEHLADLKTQLQKNPADEESVKKMTAAKQELLERLAIIKWLESPVS
jgi:SMC interacting uncharacterized protein involved in chromosome segregation